MGEPRDGEVFPVFRSPSMPSVADTLKRIKALDALLAAPLPGGRTKMPVAISLADRIRRVRDAHERRLADSEQKLAARLSDIDARSEAAVDKLDAKLSADAAAQEAEVRALEDEVNQLTNGAPA